ncbi:FKBP-type peptidyl-prolyl cis-trans isomerase [Candidatus Saccharibacteria bacterium]|nr:FKBP-type peptidyl-prolyl cis-trans isomerase [Candidatus Saccharibacteria bacterium]
MIKNEEVKTTPKQRIVIVLIALLMLGSTFALYAGLVLNYGGKSKTSTATAEEQARYTQLLAEYEDKVNKQADELSAKYFEEFKAQKARVKAFNAADIDTLETEDIKIGDGAEVTDENFTSYSAYYLGWLSDETIFDSSFDDSANPAALKTPLSGTPNIIKGWLEGIVGMKIGGIRELTIPAVMAYGENQQGTIPPNSPLKFVVMLIDPIETIQPSQELVDLDTKINKTTTVEANDTSASKDTSSEEATTSGE